MPYVNVKPREPGRVFVDAVDAVQYLMDYQVWSKGWTFSRPFGHTLDDRRRIDAAIKAKDAGAFVAHKRRGYWRIELAP